MATVIASDVDLCKLDDEAERVRVTDWGNTQNLLLCSHSVHGKKAGVRSRVESFFRLIMRTALHFFLRDFSDMPP